MVLSGEFCFRRAEPKLDLLSSVESSALLGAVLDFVFGGAQLLLISCCQIFVHLSGAGLQQSLSLSINSVIN